MKAYKLHLLRKTKGRTFTGNYISVASNLENNPTEYFHIFVVVFLLINVKLNVNGIKGLHFKFEVFIGLLHF